MSIWFILNKQFYQMRVKTVFGMVISESLCNVYTTFEWLDNNFPLEILTRDV